MTMITYDFTGQNAVVTGGTRGIGAQVTRQLLQAGAKVTAIYVHDDNAAQDFANSLEQPLAQNLHVAKLDVADYEQARKFFQEREEALHILVNSAGIRRDAVTAMMPPEDWNRVLQVNLTGTFNMTKLAVLNMVRQRYGRIVNLTSPSGQIGIEGQANYAASKAGIVALTKSVARETARRNITVNAVSPGFIDTDFISQLPQELAEQYRKSIPVRKFGTPQDVANAIMFLAAKEASYITGTVLTVAGGL